MHALLPDFDRMPRGLRSRDQWLPWMLQMKRGKRAKVPIDPNTGGWAKWSNSGVLLSFQDAVRYYRELKADGVGFFFLDTDPYVGIDLDSCRTKGGRVENWAKRIVNEFKSYSEVSPSGSGLKLVVKASKPSWAGCKVPSRYLRGYKATDPRKAIEIALTASGGYFALTGHVYRYERVRRCQRTLEDFCRCYWTQHEHKIRESTNALDGKQPRALRHLTRQERIELFDRLERADSAKACDGIGGQSRYDFALMCWMLKKGIDPESCRGLLCDYSKFKRRGKTYFDVTLLNARLKMGIDCA